MDQVAFNVYYCGNWQSNEDEDTYMGGEVKTIECKPEDLFKTLGNELGEFFYGKKVWYYYPFENSKDRKIVCQLDNSFMKMCDGARWVRVVNLFLEEEGEPCEEELRVEGNVAPFVNQDEDESFDYHDTPPNSDDEAEGRENNYVRWRRGSGELMLRQVFESLDDFKKALVDYSLKGGWNIKLTRWGNDKCSAECGVDNSDCPCKWRIYCSYEEPIGKYMVKTYEDEHSCIKDGFSKILKSRVLADLFLDDIRSDPDFRPKRMQELCEQNFNLITTIDKCRKGKKKALKIIQQEHEEQFYRLRDYRTELIRSNPGSTVEVDIVLDGEESEIFHRFYVCFANLRKQWSTWCRPIFGLDGCFLKSTLKGQLLAAVGRDANNGMYPFAWAVVDVENEDNWTWFIQKLKADCQNIQDGQGYTVISDRQKGLLNAIDRELPKIEHRMCARHIYGNLKKIFPSHGDMKGLFWRVAESYVMSEYEANLERVKAYDIQVYEAIMHRNPESCSLVFCTPTACCTDVHNNISESFNNAIDPSRYLPMVEMLETIRRRAMQRIELRSMKAKKHKGRFTKRAAAFIAEEQEKLKFIKYVSGSSEGRCEVLDCGKSVSLNMSMQTCACRRWEMSGLPCRHALRVIAKKHLNPDDYTSEWYSNAKQQHIYDLSIEPVNGLRFWKKSGTVIKPAPSMINDIHNLKGRKPKPKRKKRRHESPTKKVSRRKRIMHCRQCGQAGHNITKCNANGVDKSRKKSKYPTEDGNGSQCPSQLTQD